MSLKILQKNVYPSNFLLSYYLLSATHYHREIIVLLLTYNLAMKIMQRPSIGTNNAIKVRWLKFPQKLKENWTDLSSFLPCLFIQLYSALYEFLLKRVYTSMWRIISYASHGAASQVQVTGCCGLWPPALPSPRCASLVLPAQAPPRHAHAGVLHWHGLRHEAFLLQA